MLAKETAVFVPIAVPWVCGNSLKHNYLTRHASLQLSRKIPSMDDRIWTFLKYLYFRFLVLGKQKKNCARNTTCIAARLIWQLVIHSCVIFVIFLISRRDDENNGFLAGVSLLPPPSRVVSRPNSLPLLFRTPATQATELVFPLVVHTPKSFGLSLRIFPRFVLGRAKPIVTSLLFVIKNNWHVQLCIAHGLNYKLDYLITPPFYKIQSFILSCVEQRHNLPCPSSYVFLLHADFGENRLRDQPKELCLCVRQARSWDYCFILVHYPFLSVLPF